MVSRSDVPGFGGPLDRAVRCGEVRRVFPQTFIDTAFADDEEVLLRAALRYVGGAAHTSTPVAALSHVTALRRFGLPVPSNLPLHVTTVRRRHPRPPTGLVLHRCARLVVQHRGGLPTVSLEHCLVQSWPLLRRGFPPDVARAPILAAVQRRLTTPARITAALADYPRLPGRVTMYRLVRLLAEGCTSELELWGHVHVFTAPYLPPATAQLRVPLPVGRVVYLDRAYEAELVDVELDGAKYHYSRKQRRRDEQRDAALAALGWLPVRFGHDRLHQEPDAVRAELRAILARRRIQLGLT